MTRLEILSMTKSNLQIAGSSFDDYLEFLIDAAQNAIKAEGITIDFDAIDDCNLIVMYTSYLYRKRVGDDPVMPRMLRYALNNRVFAEKAKAKAEEGGESS